MATRIVAAPCIFIPVKDQNSCLFVSWIQRCATSLPTTSNMGTSLCPHLVGNNCRVAHHDNTIPKYSSGTSNRESQNSGVQRPRRGVVQHVSLHLLRRLSDDPQASPEIQAGHTYGIPALPREAHTREKFNCECNTGSKVWKCNCHSTL
jgi:hypothetical protein